VEQDLASWYVGTNCSKPESYSEIGVSQEWLSWRVFADRKGDWKSNVSMNVVWEGTTKSSVGE
jgi:hypothetical protein